MPQKIREKLIHFFTSGDEDISEVKDTAARVQAVEDKEFKPHLLVITTCSLLHFCIEIIFFVTCIQEINEETIDLKGVRIQFAFHDLIKMFVRVLCNPRKYKGNFRHFRDESLEYVAFFFNQFTKSIPHGILLY